MERARCKNMVDAVATIRSSALRADVFTKRLYDAAIYNRAQFAEKYTGVLTQAKLIDRATLHAVLYEAGKIYSEHNTGIKNTSLNPLYRAFNTVYPDKYSYYRFAHVLREAETKGIERVVKDHRSGNNHKVNDVVKKWLLDAMSSGKKYGPTQIYSFISELCHEYGYYSPSLSWIKTNYYKLMPIVMRNRQGADEWTYKDLPYVGIARASAPGGQWQIDGWRLPFYMAGYKTLTIFAVMDACSGRIVGYSGSADFPGWRKLLLTILCSQSEHEESHIAYTSKLASECLDFSIE